MSERHVDQNVPRAVVGSSAKLARDNRGARGLLVPDELRIARDGRRALSFELTGSAALDQQDREVLDEAIRRTGRTRFLLGRCFANALNLAIADPRVTYVEGVARPGGMFIHHAWNLINGKVVDLTSHVRGTFDPWHAYVEGIRITQHEAAEHLISLGTGLVRLPLLTGREVVNLTRVAESNLPD